MSTATRASTLIVAGPRHRPAHYKLAVRGMQLAVPILVIVLWELASGTIWSPFWISKPSLIWRELWIWISDGSLFKHIAVTFQEMILGFMLGALLGAAAGFVLGINAGWLRVLQPFIDALYTMPKLALGPLLIMWFGIEIGPKIALITLMVFFFVFINTLTGVRDVDPDLLSIVKVMGARRWDLHRMVILPSALSSILVGLKISVPYALLGAIIGELLIGNMGVGYLLNYAGGTQNTHRLFAALLVTAIMAMALNAVLGLFERRLLRWKPSLRDG